MNISFFLYLLIQFVAKYCTMWTDITYALFVPDLPYMILPYRSICHTDSFFRHPVVTKNFALDKFITMIECSLNNRRNTSTNRD